MTRREAPSYSRNEFYVFNKVLFQCWRCSVSARFIKSFDTGYFACLLYKQDDNGLNTVGEDEGDDADRDMPGDESKRTYMAGNCSAAVWCYCIGLFF